MPIRKNLPVHRDPYLPLMGPKEAAVCRSCGAVFHHKRWSMQILPATTRNRKTRSITCPACQKKRDSFPGGIITLSGEFLAPNREEILNLVRNEEARAKRVNPLERIISIKDNLKSVEIQTTSERFAQRVSMEIHRAYKGDVTYHWSRDDKFIRVKWHRGRER
ncbi:MAG TPA: BCAM0308 family protein [Nitrospiria bacterium]|jgi:NMD protein affecting ribosome stability and mRNA decay|nr:BCAM0308 family protein [Nitrospiria bacterium]